MKNGTRILWVALLVLVAIVAAGRYMLCQDHELARVHSTDGQACMIVSTRERHAMWLPGPEPPKTLAKWARFSLEVKGRKIYDTDYQDVGIYQPFPFAMDVDWAPDSSRVAYRLITTLRIVGRDGTVVQPTIDCTNSLISSFRWISNKELLVVVKEIDAPLDMFGYPQHYHGYLAKAKNTRIVKVNLDTGVSERFAQKISGPTFMFRSIGFQNQEMSPDSDRVAFSEGSAVCVYDDHDGKVIAKVPITGEIEGIWWETKDKIIVGTGLLSSMDRRFARFDLADGTIQDCTTALLPSWNRQWDSANWFRTAKAAP